MSYSFNQKVLKTIEQQAKAESIFQQIIKTTGNDSNSDAFLKDRRETVVTNDMLENDF